MINDINQFPVNCKVTAINEYAKVCTMKTKEDQLLPDFGVYLLLKY